jgi:prepilin-type processing-associated H-X9-DG protein
LTSYVPSARAFGKHVPGTKEQSIWNVTWDNCSGEKTIRDFKDGSSNTMVEVEKPMITGDQIVTAVGWGVQGSSGAQDGANLWGKTDVDAAVVPVFGTNCDDPTNHYEDGWWWLGNCTFTVNGITQEFYRTPAKLRPPEQQSFWNIYPNHTGGLVNVLMGDGSVQSVTNNIDIYAWSARVTPAGNDRTD